MYYVHWLGRLDWQSRQESSFWGPGRKGPERVTGSFWNGIIPKEKYDDWYNWSGPAIAIWGRHRVHILCTCPSSLVCRPPCGDTKRSEGEPVKTLHDLGTIRA